ncbi:hypothetical protein K438DRAFT_1761226 [Mycena galopus ATCC 62051]|nr:hypothetical protein K438DRAFT_1761226 [Mycena galopus ATCC 62051]
MPLAVNLIAHLADYEGFSNVFSRWKTEKTSLLSLGFDRQSSLDASINLSLSSPRITSGSKELLSLLSVLPNGLSEAELLQDNIGIPNILSCKAALQATSLVYRVNNQRLMPLMPIREYIQRILPPAQSHIQLMSQHFYTLVELFDESRGEQWPPLIKQITSNLANLQELLQRGLNPHAPNIIDTIKCAFSLNGFYRLTGRSHFPLVDNIQSILPQLCNHQLEAMFVRQLLNTQHYWPNISEEMVAQAINYLEYIQDPIISAKFYHAAGAYFFYYKVDAQQATKSFQKALEISDLSGDLARQCSISLSFGYVKWAVGNYSAANVYTTVAQRLSELSGDLLHAASAHHLGATCARSRGDYQQSAAQLHRAAELLHICGMSGGLMAHEITGAQAEIHLIKSEYKEARQIFCKMAETTSAEQNSVAYGAALFNIGMIGTIIGEVEEDTHHNLKTAQDILSRETPHGIIVYDMNNWQTLRFGQCASNSTDGQ